MDDRILLGLTATIFCLFPHGLGQNTNLEDSLSSMIDDLHKSYSAKYQLLDADFAKRDMPNTDRTLGEKMEAHFIQTDQNHEYKIPKMMQMFKLKILEQEERYKPVLSEQQTIKWHLRDMPKIKHDDRK